MAALPVPLATTWPLAMPMCTSSARPSSRLKRRHGVADRERGADRALGVVAVGDRGAEHRHDAVADVLVDACRRSSLDQAVDEAEEAAEQGVHLLGVELAGQPGVAGEVAEQHGHLPPLAFSRGFGDGVACEPWPQAAQN